MEELKIDLEEGQSQETKPKRSLGDLVKAFFKNKMVILGLTLLFVAVVAIGGTYLYITTSGQSIDLSTDYELINASIVEDYDFSAFIPEPPEVKEFENPLNGTLLTKDEYDEMLGKPVVIVMVNNHVAARPQSGLAEADIVYEALVESGITRYMAVFWGPSSKGATEIGPVRSIRQYYVDWAIEYKVPVVMHIGWAGYDPPLDTIIVPEADARSYILSHPNELKSYQSGFWRDATRVSPHNAYISIDKILDTAKSYGWGNEGVRESYKFKADKASKERSLTSNVDINFLVSTPNNYSVRWVYDKESNTYQRFVGGAKHIDKKSGEQLRAKNIILQDIDYRLAKDEHARILLATVDSGKAIYMLDGDVIEGTWEKTSKTGMTKFYDKDKKEMVFNRGQIWIEEIPVNASTGKVLGSVTTN